MLIGESRSLPGFDALTGGALVRDAFHSDIAVYLETMQRLRRLPVEAVHDDRSQASGASATGS